MTILKTLTAVAVCIAAASPALAHKQRVDNIKPACHQFEGALKENQRSCGGRATSHNAALADKKDAAVAAVIADLRASRMDLQKDFKLGRISPEAYKRKMTAIERRINELAGRVKPRIVKPQNVRPVRPGKPGARWPGYPYKPILKKG